jgi:hypothetical protein
VIVIVYAQPSERHQMENVVLFYSKYHGYLNSFIGAFDLIGTPVNKVTAIYYSVDVSM